MRSEQGFREDLAAEAISLFRSYPEKTLQEGADPDIDALQASYSLAIEEAA
jgi:hypothetical protein